MEIFKKELEGFIIYYNSDSEFSEMYEEIFINHAYYFEADHAEPNIIDCGANIGLATLYFKKLYPRSKMICFEPNPIPFEILQKNIKLNHLTDVTPYNIAISDKDGFADFYAERDQGYYDSLGASLVNEWANRYNPIKFKVKTAGLQNFLF